ncbi:DUF2306 domain-containing protein [Terricaulis sp.]|uniref:DUF2306 domain-containing protein n=1 Tax=Terricaulis sp. TaxID=2768686 RepID=UPI002AC64254|nr:DUF2306 domain-containing protein [Terricaulis sp.]MDZ4692899.1 DUF2306 domain-containing protein [Terricaulis sp.]
MSQTVAPARAKFPDALLNGATTLWFVVLLAGQWVFLYFIASFYGPSTLSGNFEAWDENPFLSHGYVAGDAMGNLAFAGHVIMAAIIVLGGTLQLIPQIRKHAPWFHRWNGRVFLVCAILASLAGLWIDFTREIAVEGLASNFAISFNGVLVLILAALAWRAAATRNISSHRRWALRAFVVVNGVFFLRLLVFGYIVLAQAPPSGLLFEVFSYLSYLLPLALVELYLRAKDGPGFARVGMAGVVLAASAYMAAGIVGYYLIFVRGVLDA